MDIPQWKLGISQAMLPTAVAAHHRVIGIHIAQCERTLYFVNVLYEIQATKKGPPFGEPF
ncbi:hypothetical protein A7D21_15255 [Pseudomonas sp. AP19]|nr:hypothetical protein A7D21_15255 [Pseudomonas sp. AP19]